MNIFDGGDMCMRNMLRKSVVLLLVFTMIFTLGVSALALDDMPNENIELMDEDLEKALNLEGEEDLEEKLATEEEADLDGEVGSDEELAPEEEPDLDEEPAPDEEVDQKDEADPDQEPVGKKDLTNANGKPVSDEAHEDESSQDLGKEALSSQSDAIEKESDDSGEDFTPVKEPPIKLPNYYFQKSSFRIMSGELEDTIQTKKEALRAVGCRTYDVTLTITGTPQQAPVDVVLVLDRSGSMLDIVYEYTKITSAPSTNSSYYVKVNGEYIQVSYSSGGFLQPPGWYYSVGFLNYYYVSWNINGDDNASGGSSNSPTAKPFYTRENTGTRLDHAKAAAKAFAQNVLGSGGIPGSRVSVVSFGGPISGGSKDDATLNEVLTNNFSQVENAINSISTTSTTTTNTQAGFRLAKDIINQAIQDNPNSNKVVIMFTDGVPTISIGGSYQEPGSTSHTHVQRAVSEGKTLHALADVYTIGLLLNMSQNDLNIAEYLLNQTQNKGWYSTPSAQALSSIFEEISQNLGYSATEAVVVDKIGDNFNLLVDSLPEGVEYNANTRTITWRPGTIAEKAELKYTIQAKPEFPGGLAYTNEEAILTYKDIFGQTQEKEFEKPQVDVPAPLAVSLTGATIQYGDVISLGIGLNPHGENYMSPITGGDGDGTYTYEWRIKGETEVLSNAKNPEVNPEEDTIYELTVIDSNGCKAIAEMQVKVIQHQDAIPDEPLIRVSKTFEGLTQEEINQLDGFRINIKSQDGSKDKDLHLEDATAGPIDEDGKITYVWEIEGWPAGTYIIEEFGYNHEFYEVEVENDGTVTTVAATITLETAPRVKTNTEVNNDLTFNGQYPPPNLVAAKLTANRGIFVWTETRLSASQRLAVVEALQNVSQLGLTIDNGVWYSGEDDIAGNNFYFRGYKVQYNLDTGNLNLPQSNQWALIVSASYGFEGGDAADIAVKNTYTVKTVDVTIEKEVTGNYGDMQGEFEFEVSVSGEESPRTFSLAHGEFEKLENIPINALLTLSEEARGHEVSVWIGEEQIQAEDGEYEIDLTEYDGNIIIKVVNHRDEVIDTGIMLDSMPYILILAGVTVGLGIKIVRRKRFQ